MRCEVAVSAFVFFRKHLDGCEKRSEAGAFELILLFVHVAFGNKDEMMALLEFEQSFANAGKYFDFLF